MGAIFFYVDAAFQLTVKRFSLQRMCAYTQQQQQKQHTHVMIHRGPYLLEDSHI